jgi:hypothetical protein
MTEPRPASPSVADERTLSPALAKRRYLTAAVLFFIGSLGAVVQRLAVGPMEGDLAAAVPAVMLTIYLVAMLILFTARARLRIGADGVLLRWLGRRRFVAHDEIVGIVRFEKGWAHAWSLLSGYRYLLRVVVLRVMLRSGEEIPVAVVRRGEDDEQLARIEARLRHAMDTFGRSGTAVGVDPLRRGNRGLAAWVTALRALGAGANAGARTAPMSRDQLLSVVEAPASPATDRVAAAIAIALGSDLDDDARTRLRSVSEATAAPRLRIAIEKAYSGAGEAEMEAALAEIEDEEQKVSGRHRVTAPAGRQ